MHILYLLTHICNANCLPFSGCWYIQVYGCSPQHTRLYYDSVLYYGQEIGLRKGLQSNMAFQFLIPPHGCAVHCCTSSTYI